MKFKHVLLCTFLLLVFFGCKNKHGKNNENGEVEQDKSITEANSFNNLFLDSNKIADFLSAHSEYASYKNNFNDFYKQRNYEYAWFDTSGIAEQASNFMNLLNSAVIGLNDSSLYNKKLASLFNSYVTDSTKHRKISSLETELYLTGQFFLYAAKMYNGSDINAEQLGWFIPRKKTDITALLDSVITNKAKDETKYIKLNKQYDALKAALTNLYNVQKKVSWDSIAAPAKTYKKGDSSVTIQQIKERLHLLGDIQDADTTMRYDTNTVTAVRSFQQRFGLTVTGSIDSKTMHELNYPINERIKQLLINLERVRWLPPESDSNYITVNIPEYRLSVFDSGHYQYGMNVIVGKDGSSTVIFTGNLKYIVFSPYWNVPSSIIQKEIMPAMQKDKHYIKKNNMEITGYSGKEPIVRQKPGGNNSLGLVKFLFPNNFNIYLHDTPNRGLFSRTVRNFSHGCIRIQDPKKMALYLLRYDTTYTPEKVDSLMHLDKEKWVTLKKPIRVFITYLTTWVDRQGKLNFRKDIYGHDEALADKLFVKK